MARTSLTVQSTTAFGGGIDDVTFTAADATNDHSFLNTGRTFLIMKNDDASPHTATIPGVANSRTFNAAPSVTLTCGAGEICFYGPFLPNAFNQTDGVVHLDVAGGQDTSVSFAAVTYVDTPKV